MLAGETSTILLSAKASTTFSDTDEEAAPMTTEGLAATSVWPEAELTDMSVESPESWMLWQALTPFTPPAALMSETARPTPAISGGPRKARVPVSGRMPPTAKALPLFWLFLHLSLVKVGRSALGLRRRRGLRGFVGVLRRRRAAVVGATGGKGQGQHGGAGHDLGPGHGFGTTHGVGPFFRVHGHRCLDPRGGVSGVTVNRQRCGTAHRTLSLANRYVNHRHGEPAARDEDPVPAGSGRASRQTLPVRRTDPTGWSA